MTVDKQYVNTKTGNINNMSVFVQVRISAELKRSHLSTFHFRLKLTY